jgi:hypothetical protein
MNPEIIRMVLALVRMALSNSLVSKWLDNWTAGTQNKIDDLVWDALKKVLDLKLPLDIAKGVLDGELKSIQRTYDDMTPEEKWESKKPSMSWQSEAEDRFTVRW